MTNINETNIFQIPSWNIPKLKEEIARLNKRANKIGCDPIQVITHKVEYLVEDEHKIEIHYIELKGQGPKLNGWKFLGTLDHSEYDEPIVKTVPGETIPTEYFHADGVCDHCHVDRYRKETFILQHENGGYKQVGRSCIKDFLGHNPNQVASYLSQVNGLMTALIEGTPEGWEDGEGYYGGGSKYDWYFDKIEILKITAAMIRSFGWVSRTRANDEDIQATADDVAFLVLPSISNQEREAKKQLKESIRWNDEKDLATAEAAITWLEKQDDTKDYFHNLKLINKKDDVSLKVFGIWCSLIATYQKAEEEINAKDNVKNINEWIGNVKERREFNVHVSKIIPTEGYYGWTYIHKMVDNEGHSLTWFSSSRGDMEEGGNYNIVGTVKKHDKYNDWKQTIITRVKIK